MYSKITAIWVVLSLLYFGFSESQYLVASYYAGTNCHGNVTSIKATNSECRQVGSGYQKITCGVAITIYDCTDSQCAYCSTTFLTSACITSYSLNQSTKYSCGPIPTFPNDTYIEYDFSSSNCIGDTDVVRAYYPGNCQYIDPPYYTRYTCNEDGISRDECTDEECSENCASASMSEVCYQSADGSTYQTCSTPIIPDEVTSNQSSLLVTIPFLALLLFFSL